MDRSILSYIIFFLMFIIISAGASSAADERYALLSFDLEDAAQDSEINYVYDILDKYNISATFFVVGDYALDNPDIVKNLSMKHEIGCHSMTHVRLRGMSKDSQSEEIRLCKDVLENITGKEIVGFRAPYQSTDQQLFDVLEEQGFEYDSSNIFFQFYSGNLNEVKPSHVLVTLSDYLFAYLFRSPKLLFNTLLKLKVAKPIMHVHLLEYYFGELGDYLEEARQKGYKFVTYSDYLKSICLASSGRNHTDNCSRA